MIIFCKYPLGESQNEFSEWRSIIDSFNKNFIKLEAAIESLYKLHSKYPNNYRIIGSILAFNLVSKNIINSNLEITLIKKLCAIIEDDTNYLDASSKIELLSILNRYGVSHQLNTANQYSGVSDFAGKTIIYTPMKSGFFSIIENIINADIIAKLNNFKIIINLNKNWWPYKTPFAHIFESCFNFTENFNEENNASFYFFRNSFKSLPHSFWDQYESLKISRYLTLFNLLQDYAIKNRIAINQSTEYKNTLSLYIRRGDKLTLEDINYPKELIFENLCSIAKTYSQVKLYSDDMDWIKNNLSNIHSHVVYDEGLGSGYFFGKEKNNDDDEIIRKYLNLSISDNFTGDVGSNLVNAISYTRLALNKNKLSTNNLFPALKIPLI